MSKRYQELDALRGIAASSVVFHHCLLTFPVFLMAQYHKETKNNVVDFLSGTPLHILWGGHEAVILFFILSGYVLYNSLFFGKVKYAHYVIKRITRIYLPYIFSIILSVVLYIMLQPETKSNLSSWYNGMWSHQISINEVLSYVFMLGYETHSFNTVAWSLIHEMRISLFFPFIAYLINKYSCKKSLILGFTLSIGLWFSFISAAALCKNSMLEFILQSFSMTFYYSVFFLIGALIAKNKEYLVSAFGNLSNSIKMLLIVLFFLLYTSEWWVPKIGYFKCNGIGIQSVLASAIIDYSIAIGVFILLGYIIDVKRCRKLLNAKVFMTLGRVSYSLYLLHPIVLLLMINTLIKFIAVPIIVLLVPVVSFLAALCMNKFIEKPSMSLGKALISENMQAPLS